MSDTRHIECYGGKFSPTQDQCLESAVYVTTGTGTLVDGWTWCLRHAPSKDYRRLLTDTERPQGAARFPEVYCSQCGKGFGPGDAGFSHCEDHSTRTEVTP